MAREQKGYFQSGHRPGLTTKVLALVDALGNLVRFVLLPGNRHDSVGIDMLIKNVAFDALLADKAFDSNAFKGKSRVAHCS